MTVALMPLRITGALAVALVVAVAMDVAAIVVAPTAVYLDRGRPSATINLYNPSSVPEEVSVDAFFAYPATDADGSVFLQSGGEEEDIRSAAPWVQVLPRRLVVPPGERRVVRVMARPPAETANGEYWARLVFTSRGQQLPVGGVVDSSQVQVGLNLEVRTIIALTYRQGPVETGLQVGPFNPIISGDSLIIQPGFERDGEGAFIGRVLVDLTTADGEPVLSWREQLAVYGRYDRRYAYDVSSLPSGTYRVWLRLDTDREDVPADFRLPFTPVERVAEVVRP